MPGIPNYGVAGELGSPSNAVAHDQDYFLRLFDLLYPLSYIFPMKTSPNAGYEIFQMDGAVGARLSLAVSRYESGNIILFSPLGTRSTGVVYFYRANDNAGPVKIKKGTVVSTSQGGRKFTTDDDLTLVSGAGGHAAWGAGWGAAWGGAGPAGVGIPDVMRFGPLPVSVTAIADGYEFNVRGQLLTKGGEIIPGDIDTIWSLYTDPPFADSTLAVKNLVPTTGGQSAYLDGLGKDRGIVRSPNEGIANYRVRVRSLPDTVSPAAIKRILTNLLGSRGFCFREVGQVKLRGVFFDGSPTSVDFSDFYDVDSIVLTGDDTNLGFGFQEPVVIESATGTLLAEGWYGNAVTGVGTSTRTIIRKGFNQVAPGSVVAGTRLRGLRTGTIWQPASVTNISSLVNARRFRFYLDYLEFRAFFMVGLPPQGIGEFGAAFDSFPYNAYDSSDPLINAYDGYAWATAQETLAVWNAIDAARAGGVSFSVYVERIGCT